MINITDPIVKKVIENMHKAVERKSKNLSSNSYFSLNSYDDFVLENRILKLFCKDKSIDPRRCAEEMNALYNTNLENDDIVQALRSTRLSLQDKRAELLNWAEDMVAAFAKALESHKPEDYKTYAAWRNKIIYTRDNEPHKFQARMACLMLYVKHPELDSGTDAESVEKFGNVYMKHLLSDFTDFLKNTCNVNVKNKAAIFFNELTLKDFVIKLYTKYPELNKDLDIETIKELEIVYLKTFIAEIIEDKTFEKFAEAKLLEELTEYNNIGTLQTGITMEEFLQSDPDAESVLISSKNTAK